MKKLSICLCLTLCLAFHFNVSAQKHTNTTDSYHDGLSSFYDDLNLKSDQWNLKKNKDNELTFSFKGNDDIAGHPFFEMQWGKVTLTYNNDQQQEYKEFLFDCFNKQLIVKAGEENTPYSIKKNLVKSFDLELNGQKYTFTKVAGKSFALPKPSADFYQTFGEDTRLIKEIRKAYHKGTTTRTPSSVHKAPDAFVEQTQYYVLGEDNLYHPVKLNNRSLAKTLAGDNYRKMRRLLRKNDIDLDTEVAVLEFLNSDHYKDFTAQN